MSQMQIKKMSKTYKVYCEVCGFEAEYLSLNEAEFVSKAHKSGYHYKNEPY